MTNEQERIRGEFELTEANAVERLVTFIDTVTKPTIGVGVAPDGGEYSFLTADAKGENIVRRAPISPPDGELVVGKEVFYGAPDSRLHVVSFTDDTLIRDPREEKMADLFTLLGDRVGDVLLDGANVDKVTARAVTIDLDLENQTRYVVISQIGRPPEVFKEHSQRYNTYPNLFQDIVGEKRDVTKLTPSEALKAVGRIRDAYTLTTAAMVRGYQQTALQRVKAFQR